MKRLFITLTAAWALIMSAAAMSYTTARDQALFLTDKMAYELDLTGSQYNAAYEINLDYFLSVDRYYDIFGTAWSRRNTDMSYVPAVSYLCFHRLLLSSFELGARQLHLRGLHALH